MMLRAFATILFAISAAALVWLGFEWIYLGYGLNPWIAFPLAIVIYIIPLIILNHEANEADIKLADYLESLDQKDLSCIKLNTPSNYKPS